MFRSLLVRKITRPRGFRCTAGNSLDDCPVQTSFGAKTGATEVQVLEQPLSFKVDRGDPHEVDHDGLDPPFTSHESLHQLNQGLLRGSRELPLYY